MNFCIWGGVGSQAGRCQANAESVEQIKAKEAETAIRRRSRPKTQLNLRRRPTNQRHGNAPEAEPTDEAEQSEPEEPTDK